MREILFRGKREDTGEWVYGFYTEACVVADYGSAIESDEGDYRVIKESVGQFIDFRDKHGTRIFDGDILQIDTLEPGVVVFEDGCYGVKRGNDEHITRILRTDYPEVIGNIYDNPELIPNT